MPIVPEFYKGRDVFITGTTGFMGKSLLETLLRTCPDVGHIYILIRPKRGKDVTQRVDELLKSQVYQHSPGIQYIFLSWNPMMFFQLFNTLRAKLY